MIIAFLCFDNGSLSLIAEAVARDLDPDAEVYSFGLHPAHFRRPARAALEEVGLNTRGLRAKSMMEIPIEDVSTIVSLVSRSQRPPLPSHIEVVDWPLPDPITAGEGEEVEVCRAALDELRRRIPRLMNAPRG